MIKKPELSGYSQITLAEVLAVLDNMGYAVEGMTIGDLTTGSKATLLMGGGYTPLGQYINSLGDGGDAQIVDGVIWARRGVTKEVQKAIQEDIFFQQYGFYPQEY